MEKRNLLIDAMAEKLHASRFKDFTVNGLQVEGAQNVSRVMTGVTASQALIEEAVAWGADMLLVHHGYFWKNEPVEITGMKQRRIATLLKHDINLVAWHLPLDAHTELGNNALLGKRMGWKVDKALDAPLGQGLLYIGDADEAMNHQAFAEHIASRLERQPLAIQGHDRPLKRIAWCTGAAQDMLEEAYKGGADAFVSGEISERTPHIAHELGISYFSAGHHATERDGIHALGDWLAEHFDIEHRFVDIPNPV
ncbi:GTP cyclohydrolase 1 type 2 [Halomonadaceae bacterium LMG 33818]|uniref:Nif3-like dinuclear metal center hexameric protein n=1 Tax=Cernens ardua TaxID=3402176 RepID=UPI003EDC5465